MISTFGYYGLLSKGFMYNIYDKSDVYFLYEYSKDSSRLIGNKEELIMFLSKAFVSLNFSKEIKVYDDCSRWSNKYFDDINMGGNYTHRVCTQQKQDDEGHLYTNVVEYFYTREYLFYDGFGRVVDVRDFKLEAFHYFINHRNDKRPYRIYYHYNRYKQWKYGHCGTYYHHKAPKNRRCVRRLDDIFDSEYKEYHFKHLEDSNNPYPDWWDDAARRVEGNWKSQYKVNRQYNIHKNVKDDKSIRKDFLEEEFSKDEIDNMLYEDFLNNN